MLVKSLTRDACVSACVSNFERSKFNISVTGTDLAANNCYSFSLIFCTMDVGLVVDNGHSKFVYEVQYLTL